MPWRSSEWPVVSQALPTWQPSGGTIRDGVEALTRFDETDLEAAGIAARWYRAPGHVRAGTILGDIAAFDVDFFGVCAGARLSEVLQSRQPPIDLFGHDPEPPAHHFQRLLASDKDYVASRVTCAVDLRGHAVSVTSLSPGRT